MLKAIAAAAFLLGWAGSANSATITYDLDHIEAYAGSEPLASVTVTADASVLLLSYLSDFSTLDFPYEIVVQADLIAGGQHFYLPLTDPTGVVHCGTDSPLCGIAALFQVSYSFPESDFHYFLDSNPENYPYFVGGVACGIISGLGSEAGSCSAGGTLTYSFTAAPEPNAWVMLVLGFASIGLALRRRPPTRRVHSPAATSCAMPIDGQTRTSFGPS